MSKPKTATSEADLDALDAKVEQLVFGLAGPGALRSRAIGPAWEVHLEICSRAFSVRRRCFAALQDQARTGKGHVMAWPDVLVVLRDRMPEAICRAALTALASARPPKVVSSPD